VISAVAPVHRLSVEDVLAMVRAGVLDEHARTELVEGVLVDLTPIGPQHDGTLEFLTERFVKPADGWKVRVRSMFLTPGGYLLRISWSSSRWPTRLPSNRARRCS